ncbi:MAG: hypothetical protein NZL83_00630 [Candidatus Absconditabacterales bacterium]|nr:hypothetical protein [Candidatus Absconditabacterales bacterium]
MRSSTIKGIIVAVLAIFLLTTVLTAIVAVREASRPLPSEPLTPTQETPTPQVFTGTTGKTNLATGQVE